MVKYSKFYNKWLHERFEKENNVLFSIDLTNFDYTQKNESSLLENRVSDLLFHYNYFSVIKI